MRHSRRERTTSNGRAERHLRRWKQFDWVQEDRVVLAEPGLPSTKVVDQQVDVACYRAVVAGKRNLAFQGDACARGRVTRQTVQNRKTWKSCAWRVAKSL